MRLFVSVDLDTVSEAIADLQTRLAGLDGIRLTPPEDAHITMKFLGEGDHDIEALSGAIETAIEASGVGPFEAILEGVGAFPSSEYIRVIWLGVQQGSEPLTELHGRLEAETIRLGYDPESHEFTPHVSLARMEHAAAKVDVQRFLRRESLEIGPFRVDELRLKESTLTAEGPNYRTVEGFSI